MSTGKPPQQLDINTKLILASMPKGVEHAPLGEEAANRLVLILASMPKGVEHSCDMASRKPASSDPRLDAERR